MARSVARTIENCGFACGAGVDDGAGGGGVLGVRWAPAAGRHPLTTEAGIGMGGANWSGRNLVHQVPSGEVWHAFEIQSILYDQPVVSTAGLPIGNGVSSNAPEAGVVTFEIWAGKNLTAFVGAATPNSVGPGLRLVHQGVCIPRVPVSFTLQPFEFVGALVKDRGQLQFPALAAQNYGYPFMFNCNISFEKA